MRSPIKTISTEVVKFIPKKHLDDTSLSENAPKISDRPLVFMVKKLTREHKYNLQGLLDLKKNKDAAEGVSISNFGSLTRYIWDTCVVEVRNVITDEGEFESVKGDRKSALFDTVGIDEEIMEVVKHVQDISSLTEQEIKN